MMLFSPSFQFGTNLDSRILVQSETSSQVGRVQLRTTSLRITKYSLRTAKDSTTGVLPAGLMGLVVALAGHGSERARNQKSSTHQDKDRQPEETNEDRDRSQLFGWQGAAVSRNSKGQKSHEGGGARAIAVAQNLGAGAERGPCPPGCSMLCLLLSMMITSHWKNGKECSGAPCLLSS